MEQSEKTLDMIVNLCKNRGYVFPGSEIYGGLANSWDYGPLGVEFKNNVKKAWLKKFVQESPYNVGLDAAIIMNPQTWVTTGHVSSFSDPLLDCRACKARHRADKLIGEEHPEVNVDAMSFDEMDAFIAEHEDIVCPVCGKHDFTPIRKFNLMFKTAIGVTEDSSSTCYLRPETAQGIFVNFANIQRTTRRKLPFGVCQVGKAFRNEITPGNFTFRTREFEQMECEFFCKPGTDLEWFSYWKDYCENWLLSLGIKKEHLRLRDHEPAELAFYSRATTDIEYAFPFTDWGEPLLLAVSAHEGFVDVAPDERNCLFFQILRFARDFLALPLNDFARLIRLRHAPHGIKRVHVEGHVVQAILVFCQRRVCEAVKRGEAVGVLPNLLVVGVEDVRAVAVDGNAADVLGVDVARDVAPLVDYKHALALFLRHLRERRAEQPRADDEIIILHIFILLVDDTFR